MSFSRKIRDYSKALTEFTVKTITTLDRYQVYFT